MTDQPSNPSPKARPPAEPAPETKKPSGIGELLSEAWQVFYKWLGITSGSLGDIPGNHVRVGYIFIEKGQAEEAVRRAKLALWMRPNFADAYALKAHAHALLGEKAEAQKAYTEANKNGYAKMDELKEILSNDGKVKKEPQPSPEQVSEEEEGDASFQKIAKDV